MRRAFELLLHRLGLHDWEQINISWYRPIIDKTLSGLDSHTMLLILHGATRIFWRCRGCGAVRSEVLVGFYKGVTS